jgi:hypothetical protein
VLGDRLLVNALIASKLYAVSIGADGAAGKAVEIKTDRVVERPDGMRSFGGSDLLIAEGGGAGRLSRVTVTGDTGKAVTLKEGFPDGPVAVTVVGTTAYVLEGQLGLMMNPPKPGETPSPAAVQGHGCRGGRAPRLFDPQGRSKPALSKMRAHWSGTRESPQPLLRHGGRRGDT